MLSLLLTAVLLLGALIAALHLRSITRIAVVLGLAGAAFLLLARRPLEPLAEPRIRLVYEVDAAHAVEPGPALIARTGATVEGRLKALGLRGAEIVARDTTVDIRVAATAEEIERVRAALAAIGLVEFVAVADDDDFFKQYTFATDLPKGIRMDAETAPLGPGKTAPRYYVVMARGEGEPMNDTLKRLKAWTDSLPVPEGKRISFERRVRHDIDTDVWEDEGWRTFLLDRSAILTGRHIREAQARPDLNSPGAGRWLVALEFTGEGGDLFEEATGRMIKRRFAILLDGIVESAPQVLSRIGGGHGVITMGAGDIDEQARTARQLEAVLRSGALPAPLILLSEERIDPILGPGLFNALVGLAGLLLLGAIGAGLWLGFARKAPAR